jgi:hypothetical protein
MHTRCYYALTFVDKGALLCPLQLEKAVQHIASRVDELALQPEVYGARVEAQLASLALEQRTIQVCSTSITAWQSDVLTKRISESFTPVDSRGPASALLAGNAAAGLASGEECHNGQCCGGPSSNT